MDATRAGGCGSMAVLRAVFTGPKLSRLRPETQPICWLRTIQLPAGVRRALIGDVSETNQSEVAFGRKAKTKDSSAGGLLTLGIAGIVACLAAIAMVLMNMA
jgi:hypothetical protein